MTSLYQKIGATALRAVICDFYDRVFRDTMIGFLFWGKDKKRLIEKEFEFTAVLLGDNRTYTGRSMPEAHAKSPILGGHFERRLVILSEVLADHQVADEVRKVWLSHTRKLRTSITKDRGSECNHAMDPNSTQER